jgi:hypothetical protein
MFVELKAWLHCSAIRAVAGCLFALMLCGAASAQNLTCPVISNVNITGTTTNVASTCLIDLGIVVNVLSSGTLNNEGPHGYDGTLLNEGTLANGGTINNFCIFGLGGNLCNGGSSQDTIYNALSTLINVGQINGGLVLNTGLIDNLGGIGISTLTNAADGTINNVGGIELGGFTPTSTNNGTIQNFSASSLTVDAFGSLTNNGTLLNDAGATLTNGGALRNSAGATLTNDGTFTNGTFSKGMEIGSFENDGTFTNNGTLTGEGSLQNSGNSITPGMPPSSHSSTPVRSPTRRPAQWVLAVVRCLR